MASEKKFKKIKYITEAELLYHDKGCRDVRLKAEASSAKLFHIYGSISTIRKLMELAYLEGVLAGMPKRQEKQQNDN